jgi:hypothetical protein
VILRIFIWGLVPLLGAQAEERPQGRSSNAKIRFDGKPEIGFARFSTEFSQLRTIRVFATVVVTDTQGRPLPREAVTCFARSTAGAIAESATATDANGRAYCVIPFDERAGSLDLSVKAWLPHYEDKPDVETDAAVRNRVDLDLTFESIYVAAPVRSGSGYLTDNVFFSTANAQLQLNLFEREANYRYYQFGFFGRWPGTVTTRGICCVNAEWQSLGAARGSGDPEAGIHFNIASNFYGELGYKGRAGSASPLQSYRSGGYLRPVGTSDGIEALTASLRYVQPFHGNRRFWLISGAASRGRPRFFDDGRRAERDEHFQTSAGIGFIRRPGGSAVVIFGGRNENGGLRLTQGTAIPITLQPRQRDWLVGIQRIPLIRGPLNFGLGLTVGGLGTSRPYVSTNVRVGIHIL